MSNYLGFEPCDNPNYFFVSYNNEDAERVSEIAQRLHHGDIPLWYDRGINAGDNWESKISERMVNAQAVILFFTKNILFKENSYVYKEYLMASEYFDKKVYIVMMDKINNKDVPHTKVPWWIDIQAKQSICIFDIEDMSAVAEKIAEEIGMATREDKMNLMVKNYKAVYDSGKYDEAELYLTTYMNGMTLAGKAKCIADMFSGKTVGIVPIRSAVEIKAPLEKPLINHVGSPVDTFFECEQLKVGECVFTFGNSIVFHRSSFGDAHVINVWRDEKNIFTVGRLVEAREMNIYYDSLDDIIYMIYFSEDEKIVGLDCESTTYVSVLTIENPADTALCNSFKFLVEL